MLFFSSVARIMHPASARTLRGQDQEEERQECGEEKVAEKVVEKVVEEGCGRRLSMRAGGGGA